MADPIRLNTNPIWPSVNFPDPDLNEAAAQRPPRSGFVQVLFAEVAALGEAAGFQCFGP